MSSTFIDRLSGLAADVAIKAPCRAATTANITRSGEQTIDGIAVVADDRVLVKDQTDQTENGIYVADSSAWARAEDFNGARDVVKGTQVLVTSGTAASGILYQVTTSNPITIGTSNIAFTPLAISGANAKLTALGAMDSTAGVVVQTGASTFTKRTLTGTAGQIIVTNGDGVSGDPTFTLDPTLIALGALDGTAGLLTQTGADTFVRRTLAAPAAGFTITNPAGTAGNPTFVLADDLAALEGMSGTGFVARTGVNTYSQLTLTGTTAQITVTNGGGGGTPTISLPTAVQFGASHTFSGTNNAIMGGDTNTNTGTRAFIGGGQAHTASSTDSAIIGGNFNNITSGTRGVIAGGATNSLSGNNTDCGIFAGSSNSISSTSEQSVLLGGSTNTITAGADYSAILGGTVNTITATGGDNAILAGAINTISGSASDSAVLAGITNTITTGANSAIVHGIYAKADKYCQKVHASGRFTVVGDAQASDFVMRKQTTNSTPAEMFLNGSSLRMTIPSDSTWGFDIMVVARRTDADNESAFYRFEGAIDNNAGTTALVAAVVAATPIEDTAAWACAVTADDTNDALIITVTGENSKTINWVARVSLVEVIG